MNQRRSLSLPEKKAVWFSRISQLSGLYSVFTLCLFLPLQAQVKPSYFETVTHDVDDGDADVKSRTYTDGFGRVIQTQVLDNVTGKATVTASEFDEAMRPTIAIKPFAVADNNSLSFMKGSLIENANAYYDGSNGRPDAGGKAFSETQYYDDPMGRVKAAGAPGTAFAISGGHPVRSWTFGVTGAALGDGTFAYFDEGGFVGTAYLTIACLDGTGATGEANIPEFLDYQLTEEQRSTFKYLLSVSMDENGTFSQQLIDLFGNIVKTRVYADISQPDAIIESSTEYDIMGNITKEIPPTTTDHVSVGPTTYDFNALGQLISKTTPDAGTVTYSYDEAGFLDETWDANSATTAGRFQGVKYGYDESGRVVTISRVRKNDDGSIAEFNTRVRNFYDNAEAIDGYLANNTAFSSRAIEIRNSLTNTQGRLVAAIAFDDFYVSADMVETKYSGVVIDLYSYDEDGLVATKYKSIPGIPLQQSDYTYDQFGKPLTQSITIEGMASKIVLVYTYDKSGRLAAIKRDDQECVTYHYDETGKLDKKSFKGGTAPVFDVSTSYTIRDWVKTIKANPSATPSDVKFSQVLYYDDGGDDPSPEFTGCYNGNISRSVMTTSVPGTNPGKNLDLLYRYDGANRLNRVRNIYGITGYHNYDIVDNEYDANFSYLNDGRLLTKNEGLAQVEWEDYEYYEDIYGTNRLKGIAGSGTRTTTSSPAYIYDANGNMVFDRSKKMAIEYDWRNMPVNFYFYQAIDTYPEDFDDVYTLYKSNTARSLVCMTYDVSGNRVLKETFEFPDTGEPPEIPQSAFDISAADGSAEFAVAQNGMLSTTGTVSQNNHNEPADGALILSSPDNRQFSLSTLGLQTEGAVVGDGDGTVQDGDLIIESMEAPGEIPQAACGSTSGSLLLAGPVDGVDAVSGVAYVDQSHGYVKSEAESNYGLSYVNISGEGISRYTPAHPETAPVNEFYLKDHLGSTRAVINEGSTSWLIQEAIAYLAYGAENQLTQLPPDNVTRQKYTGKELDQEGVVVDDDVEVTSGMRLNYFGARYYDPVVGVFLGVDPAEQYFNLYSYGNGNPINGTDPSGMLWYNIDDEQTTQWRSNFDKNYYGTDLWNDYQDISNNEMIYIDQKAWLGSKVYGKEGEEYMWMKTQFDAMLDDSKNEWVMARATEELGADAAKTLGKSWGEARYNATEAYINDYRNNYNVHPEKMADALKAGSGWTQLSQAEAIWHTFDAPQNLKFVKGNYEAVFDSRTGLPVTDPRNMATFNIVSHLENAELHTKYDVNPYFRHGTGYADPTNAAQRYGRMTEWLRIQAAQRIGR